MPFKKKKRPSSLRSTTAAEPEADESVLDTIQSTNLRRSVLNQEGKKVVRPEDLMKTTSSSTDTSAISTDSETKSRQNLAFDTETGKTETGESLLEAKKKRIMEEYINRNMTGAAVQENVVEEKRENIEGEKEDGDVGAGGAVLGGTGIAEVELPSSYKKAAVTAQAAAAAVKKRPSSSVPAMPGYDFKRQKSEHDRKLMGIPDDEGEQFPNKSAPLAAPEPSATERRDADRTGFKTEADGSKEKKHKRDKDDSFFQKYMRKNARNFTREFHGK